MATKRLNHKPGSDTRRFAPDVIETYPVNARTALMPFLLEVMPHRKRTNVKELLKHNQVAVNGAPVTQFDHSLNPGDEVKVNLTREFRVFYHRRLKLVYEDDDIIVVDKGYGLLSVSTDRVKDGTVYSIVREYVKWNNPANKVFIVHRLDRDTSGLMMLAKNIETKERLQHNWNNMVLSRRYLAVVEGVPEPSDGVVRSYLAQNRGLEVYSTDNPEEGQLAITHYSTLRAGNGYALMEVELDTGRKNQIRVHMKDLGHPISGDRKYGARTSPIGRLALHARTLRFVHPTTRRVMDFSTPVPPAFAKMVNRGRSCSD